MPLTKRHSSLAAFALAVVLVTLVGLLARYYIGKRAIAWFDQTILRVPLLNKIYGTIKQVNEALTVGKKKFFQDRGAGRVPARGQLFRRLHHQRAGRGDGAQDEAKTCGRVHPHHAESHVGLPDFCARGPRDEARHVGGRGHQVHHQSRLRCAGPVAIKDVKLFIRR
ncbi:MAG: DUF502 domain-containing protein [Pedosphaera sp.]|nr:DUF502 domain-containing protein [Pedosphaera sp.]